MDTLVPTSPQFFYTLGQVGAEKAIKIEVEASFPSLHFAFSRPGFITFKNTGAPLELKKIEPLISSLIFTRSFGEVLAQDKHSNTSKLPDSFLTWLNPKQLKPEPLIHILDRDTYLPGDEPENFKANTWSSYFESFFDAQRLTSHTQPKLHQEIFDLIAVDSNHYFLGRRFHLPYSSLFNPLSLPSQAPSRAYLKIEEAIQIFLEPKALERFKKVKCEALELGCSPGGATFAMMNHGLFVTGVDPKKMDPSIHTNSKYKHIQKRTCDLVLHDLKNINPTWLVVDMSIAPLESLDEIKHALALLKKAHGSSLKLTHAFITLKLNDWKFHTSIPLYLKRIQELGFKMVIPKQLTSNKQEIIVFANQFSLG